MGTTPVYVLPYPEPVDTPDVPRDINALATALDKGLCPVTQVFRSGALTVTSTVAVIVPTGTDFAECGAYSSPAGGVVVDRAGKFLIAVQAEFYCQNNNGLQVVADRVGFGVVTRAANGGLLSSGGTQLEVTAGADRVVRLAAGNTVQLKVNAESSNSSVTMTYCSLSLVFLGP